MNSVSKVKIAVGYTLLLGVLLFSLFFVHREMENLMHSENQNVHWTDSLTTLLREKDENTIYMLRVLSETSESMVSTSATENIIATRQDSVVTNRRVQRRIITYRDTVATKPKKKGFFRRLGEVFVPPKKGIAIQVKISLEYVTDTVIDVHNPVDSLQEKLRAVAQQKRVSDSIVRRRRLTLQRMNKMLAARIDSLLKGYEQETLQCAREEADYRQPVRGRSVKIIGSIAVGAVLLSVFFLITVGRDIARSNRYRRELEEARKRAKDLLAMREKMMLAITHDFKAPLGSIMGYADLLSWLTVDERQRSYLDNMKTSSEHLLKPVIDLLDSYRPDLHKAEINQVTFHPARLLGEIHISSEPPTSAKGLELHCNIAPELEGTYISDPLRLRQIINNLLSNAVKFTDEGCVTMTTCYENHELVVAVADVGKNMGPADRERIPQEFARLPGAQGKEGFGLGLSIVRMFVQLLEGTIDVDSVPDKGSTFTLRVPLFPVRMPEHTGEEMREKEEEPLPVPSSPLPRILLTDDDSVQPILTVAMLQHSGIISVSYVQPDELLDALHSGTFDVLLTDVQMPAIGGFDLLKLLRASNLPQAQTIPVIAVIARSDMKPEEFKAYGFTGCLHKPSTVAELFRELDMEGIGWMPALQDERMSEFVTEHPAEHTSGTFASGCPYNFSALTVSSGDDSDVADSIPKSFISETRINAGRLQKAVDMADIDEVAAVSRKMILLSTLTRATELVGELEISKSLRGASFTEEQEQRALRSLALIEDVLRSQTRTDLD